MSTPCSCFSPGTLWQSIVEQTRHALRCGALEPVRTEPAFLEEGVVRFQVRSVSSLARKDRERRRQQAVPVAGDPPTPRNPFLPYAPDLFVAGISPTHVGLLNKFPVIDHHLLIVTRDFEDQDTVLTRSDFQALWRCLVEFDSLGFYNGGTSAGASQPHKHLQLVPLPLASDGPEVPIAPWLGALPPVPRLGCIKAWPFRHGLVRLDLPAGGDADAHGEHAWRYYLELLAVTGLGPAADARPTGPYNLIVTRDWMLLVPRSRECFEGISINSLAYAGSWFVRDEAQLRRLAQHAPSVALTAVSVQEEPAGGVPIPP